MESQCIGTIAKGHSSGSARAAHHARTATPSLYSLDIGTLVCASASVFAPLCVLVKCSSVMCDCVHVGLFCALALVLAWWYVHVQTLYTLLISVCVCLCAREMCACVCLCIFARRYSRTYSHPRFTLLISVCACVCTLCNGSEYSHTPMRKL